MQTVPAEGTNRLAPALSRATRTRRVAALLITALALPCASFADPAADAIAAAMPPGLADERPDLRNPPVRDRIPWNGPPERKAVVPAVPEPSSLPIFALALWIAAAPIGRWSGASLLRAPARERANAGERPFAHAAKRSIDVIGAALGLVLAAPLIALCALAVRLDSKGPAFFSQTRCGRHGRRFPMWKLRSMVCNAEAIRPALEELNQMSGPVFKLDGDPRVTRVGRWLRRLSLDELPQLWNVLRGEMSLVGPRPPLPSEVEQYGFRELGRLRVKPGLTCTWQVSGRNEIGFERWVEMDLDYIENWSLTRDLSLLARTLPAVVSGRGAS